MVKNESSAGTEEEWRTNILYLRTNNRDKNKTRRELVWIISGQFCIGWIDKKWAKLIIVKFLKLIELFEYHKMLNSC
jgi:hypothetical protein